MKVGRLDLIKLGLSKEEAQCCINLAGRYPFICDLKHKMGRTSVGSIASVVIFDIEKLYTFVSTRDVKPHIIYKTASVRNAVTKAYELFKREKVCLK